ncbi:MAG: bacteriocin family protein [Anaerolineae bacterium]|jgi:uncharacterized linocin/CFP29 family protein|nr:bacteriocin family protein [Anaerolineae bacterium]
MSEYLLRDAAPLSDGDWQAIDGLVVKVAREFLIGRRFLDLVGPFGAGMEIVPVGVGEARKHIALTVIEQPFALHWRDIEASRKLGVPIELGPAAQAAMACARMEDQMILGALWDAAEKGVPVGDWHQADGPLQSVVAATQALFSDGFFGPYAVLMSPDLYTQTQRVSHGMGKMVGKLIADVAEGGMFRTPLLSEAQGMVLALGAYNFDLVVGQDLVTAYAGNEGLDHNFRVLETLALRVKRAGAICKLEG